MLLQPLRRAAMDDLFSKPHQADERTQGAGDNEAALKTIGKQVLTAETQTEMQDSNKQKKKKRKSKRLNSKVISSDLESSK